MAWRDDLHEFIDQVSVGVHVWQGGSLVEGHRGLLTYTPTVIKVRRRRGTVTLEGEDLSVRRVTRDEVWIAGVVKAVHIDA